MVDVQLSDRPAKRMGLYAMRLKSLPNLIAAGAVATIVGFITGACSAKESAMSEANSLTIQDVFGHYQLTGPDLPTTCRLTLDPISNSGQLPILTSRCGSANMSSASHWRVTREGFDLLSKGDAVLIGFRRLDVDRFEGRDASGRVYRLERAPMT
jgi:hypothetical protein